MEVFVQVLKVVSANTLSDDSRTGTGSSHWQTCSLIPAAFMVSQAFQSLAAPFAAPANKLTFISAVLPSKGSRSPKRRPPS